MVDLKDTSDDLFVKGGPILNKLKPKVEFTTDEAVDGQNNNNIII